MTGTSLISRMADRRHMDPQTFYETIKQTLVPSNTTKEQLAAFLMVADRYQLDPLTKEIYAFPNRKGTGITPVVSLDGWVNLVNSHPQSDGFSFAHERDDEGRLFSMTCTMHRKDRAHPIEVTEFYAECYRNTEPWNQMPSRMLRHKAFKEAARLAFGFSGITDEDEARDISGTVGRPVVLERVADSVTDALDAFAGGAEAAAAPGPPQTTGAEAGAAPPTPEAAPASSDNRDAVIDQVLKAALEGRDHADRLAELDAIAPYIRDSLDGVASPGFVHILLDTAGKVAKAELTANAARKYLKSLPREQAA